MMYPDPMDVKCVSCEKISHVPLADLFSPRAVCSHCGVSLAESVKGFRRFLDQQSITMIFVYAIMGLEDAFGVPIPDETAEPLIKEMQTKAEFVGAFVSFLEASTPNVNAEAVSDIFDRAVVEAGYDLPVSAANQSLFEWIDVARFRKVPKAGGVA